MSKYIEKSVPMLQTCQTVDAVRKEWEEARGKGEEEGTGNEWKKQTKRKTRFCSQLILMQFTIFSHAYDFKETTHIGIELAPATFPHRRHTAPISGGSATAPGPQPHSPTLS
jgi:hypothetical protein